MAIDLNASLLPGNDILSAHAWWSKMNQWITATKGRFQRAHEVQNSDAMTPEERTLLRYIHQRQSYPPLPTDEQLFCIMDHIEIAGDSQQLWATISLELAEDDDDDEHDQQLHNPKQTDWQQSFKLVCAQLQRKQEIRRKLAENSILAYSPSLATITEMERRILNSSCLKEDDDRSAAAACRVCLRFVRFDNLSSIFVNEIAERIVLVSQIPEIIPDDGWPQNICNECLLQLDTAYKFKLTCEQSWLRLQNVMTTVKYDADSEPSQANDISQNASITNGVSLPAPPPPPPETTLIEVEFVGKQEEDSAFEYEGDFNDDEAIEEEEDVEEVEEDNEDDVDVVPTNDRAASSVARKTTTTTVVNFRCSHCAKIFLSIDELDRHSASVHSAKKDAKKPFVCKECGKRFGSRISLKIHTRCHTDERPYICETCGKAFRTCSAVNVHRVIHSDAKDFSCTMCAYRASTKANLRIHERTHSQVKAYGCAYCDRTFRTISNMHKHTRNVHEKLKTHKCNQCDRSFFTRESARKHSVTHSGLKPYSCPVCMASYGWYNGLQKHMKVIHPGAALPTERTLFNIVSEAQNL